MTFAVHFDAPTGAWGTVTRNALSDAAAAWNEALHRCEALDASGQSDGARVRVQFGHETLYDWTRRGGCWTHTGEGAPTP